MAPMMNAPLVLAMAMFTATVTAQNVSQMPNTVAADVITRGTNPQGPLTLLVAPLVSCEMTVLIQPGDTCASIT